MGRKKKSMKKSVGVEEVGPSPLLMVPPPPPPPTKQGEKLPPKSKKKTAEDGGPPPPPPGPPSPPKPKKKEEGDGGSNRTYLKIKAVFKCSKDTCGKTWSSVHAWERDEQFFCDLCGVRADVVTFKDEMCELANYNCGGVSCGGNHWQSIHDGLAGVRRENCDICGGAVAPNGTQLRFGRHFWFECTSPSCGEGWEDFSLTPQRTQRCGISTCRSRGDVIGTTKVRLSKGGGEGRRGAMAHNWENCDMCVDLHAQGKASSCLKYKKVHCRVEQQEDGVVTEIITGIQ